MPEYLQMDIEDNEVSELLAGNTESLPTEEQEAESIAVQRNTPLSLQEEEMVNFEEDYLFERTYKFETIKTDVDFAFETLIKNFPDEDFESDDFQRMDIHKYLSSEMSKLEFFIAHNQWGYDFVNYPKDVPVRMRKGVISRFNTITKNHDIYHMSCIDSDHPGFTSGGFTKGILTTQARNVKEFMDLIIGNPELFFCKYCELYMFDCVEHFDGQAWDIPPETIWPTCNYVLQSVMFTPSNEETYVDLYGHKVIAVISPQEPPKKKVCRRLTFDE